jgi:RNA polymerase sigma-70 factor, ECF subfamily
LYIVPKVFMNISKLDNGNFELLFRENYTVLCRYCIQFVRVPEIAEEIVQDQFITLWEKREQIEIHTSVKAYLYKSVKNKSIDYLKSKYARLKSGETAEMYNIADNNSPQSIIEGNEATRIIEMAIKQLPEKCYAVFSLSRFGGMSNKEIADELNISVKTVENQVTIALRKIKDFLRKHGISIIIFIGYLVNKLISN